MGGQIITFFIGQCGCQIASASWELYCLEHSISPDGRFYDDSVPDDSSFYNFFSESRSGQFVPRSLLIDLEPTVLDEIKVGRYRQLFHPETLIGGNEDASNNFARGFYSCGKLAIKEVIRNTRKLVENCDKVQAFMAHHSFGGGTGSGFTSMLLEYLSVEYSKRTKVEFGVFPSPTLSVSVVEPYNAVLALHTPMENADVAIFFENESLYKICSNNLLVDAPYFTHLNRMAAQVISGMTCSLRFEGPINTNIIDYQTNLVPYPRIHFPLVSFSPFLAQSKISHYSMSTREITFDAFPKENQMAETDPSHGIYMSCCMLYRGDVNVREVNDAISYQKAFKNQQWVDWCPTGYKIGINYQPMIAVPGSGISYSSRSLTLLCNTTAVKQVVSRLNHKFMLMYMHKSFFHWYVAEGMEEDEFKEAFEDVMMLEKDFEVIEQTTSISSQSVLTVDDSKSNCQIYSGINNLNLTAFHNQSELPHSETVCINSVKSSSLSNLQEQNQNLQSYPDHQNYKMECENNINNICYLSTNSAFTGHEPIRKSNIFSPGLVPFGNAGIERTSSNSSMAIDKIDRQNGISQMANNSKLHSRKYQTINNVSLGKLAEHIKEFNSLNGERPNDCNKHQSTVIVSDSLDLSAYQKVPMRKSTTNLSTDKLQDEVILNSHQRARNHSTKSCKQFSTSTLNFISATVNIC